jgi:hypothetical protein
MKRLKSRAKRRGRYGKKRPELVSLSELGKAPKQGELICLCSIAVQLLLEGDSILAIHCLLVQLGVGLILYKGVGRAGHLHGHLHNRDGGHSLHGDGSIRRATRLELDSADLVAGELDLAMHTESQSIGINMKHKDSEASNSKSGNSDPDASSESGSNVVPVQNEEISCESKGCDRKRHNNDSENAVEEQQRRGALRGSANTDHDEEHHQESTHVQAVEKRERERSEVEEGQRQEDTAKAQASLADSVSLRVRNDKKSVPKLPRSHPNTSSQQQEKSLRAGQVGTFWENKE